MLVNPVVSDGTRAHNSVVPSDNPFGADDQQERSITIGWVIGFVDGEGCFSVGLTRQAGSESRIGYRTGWQVNHRFVVVQGAKSVDALYSLRDFLGVGRVYENRRRDNHKESLHMLYVQRRRDLLEVVIPFFERYHLRTSKRRDFEIFARCVRMVDQGQHLHNEGLAQMAELMQTMNHQKPRQELIEILRGHTPDIRDIG